MNGQLQEFGHTTMVVKRVARFLRLLSLETVANNGCTQCHNHTLVIVGIRTSQTISTMLEPRETNVLNSPDVCRHDFGDRSYTLTLTQHEIVNAHLK